MEIYANSWNCSFARVFEYISKVKQWMHRTEYEEIVSMESIYDHSLDQSPRNLW